MTTIEKLCTASRRTLLSVGLIAASIGLATVGAQAGECPAGKTTTDGQKPGPSAHSNVTDDVIGSIDLAKEKVALKDYKFRMRRLVVQPGGVVAWHSHAERPAIIYIVSGAIMEYSSSCAVPIKHKAGEVAVEKHTTSHWWKNEGRQPVVLLSSDILHDAQDPKTM